MIMKTRENRPQLFLVLVPHRDVRLVLQDYTMTVCRRAVRQAAYSFPWAAPLASLSRPLNIEELKHCARAVRETSLTNDGKINAGETSTALFPVQGSPALFGPRLDIVLPPNIFDSGKITGLFSPQIIGCCLLTGESKTENLPPPPKVFFRAAAVANMFWRPHPLGYKWKIGQLRWLPKA